MVAETFPHALRLVLVDEGGLDDDPHDHGGRTAHGIIQREYDGFRARHGQPAQDVWKITPAEYTEIYHDRYWMPWCDRLPAGMDYAFFDACVNAGPAQAARTLQRALALRTDGNLGDVTLAKVKEASEHDPEATTRGGLSDDLKVEASARAKAEDTAKPPLSTEAGAATTTGTVIGAGVTDTLGKASEQLGPFQDALHAVKYLLLGIAVVSI